MKTTLVVIAGILALTTSVHETTELLPTKLAARLFIYGQMLVTWHLWACGSSWKLISLHILGIVTSMSLDTTTPHHTAYGLLLHACGYLFIIVSTFNKDKHVRTVSQLFSSSPPPTLNGINCHSLTPHLFDLVELMDTDDSSDEDHLPPNFLNEPFMEGNLAPTAG